MAICGGKELNGWAENPKNVLNECQMTPASIVEMKASGTPAQRLLFNQPTY